jgi:hypothetical protein
MPSANGSAPGAPAAGTVAELLCKVTRSSDATEIDLCKAVIKSSDPVFQVLYSTLCEPSKRGAHWFASVMWTLIFFLLPSCFSS